MCDPNADNCRCKRLSNKIAQTLDDISALIAQAIKDPSVTYENAHLIKCWEVKNCAKNDCPAYKNENLRCWQVVGTYCGGEVRGTFAQKHDNCVNCEIFKTACAHGNDAIGEQFNNLLHLLHEKDKRAEALNQQLLVIESLILKTTNNPEVRCQNNNLLKCWEVKNCEKKDCPSYQNKNLRCWQIAGTHCGGKVQGKFTQKLGYCQKCVVFQIACRGNISAVGEQFNNLLHLFHEKAKKAAALNSELMNALNDLTKRNQTISNMGLTDNLTGLYNRNYMFNRLEGELERFKRHNHPLSLLMLDIDAFKEYNRIFGHLEGDLLLKKFGQIVKNSIRKIDLTCRFGGDEFVVVLPNTEQKTALLVAKRILQELKHYTFYPQQEPVPMPIHKTVSIGVATASKNDTHLESLIVRADKAMHHAKENGGNKVVVFSPRVMAVKSAA